MCVVDGRNGLQLLLSFAVGGLLGDVFLHLLPEAWSMAMEGVHHTANIGWVSFSLTYILQNYRHTLGNTHTVHIRYCDMRIYILL